MLYEVRLRMAYDYDRPVAGGRHHVRVIPLAIAGRQKVISASLSIEPHPADRSDSDDFFGNRVTALSYRDEHSHFSFSMGARVAVEQAQGAREAVGIEELGRQIAGSRSLAPDSPHHFLGASRLIQADRGITAFARESIRKGANVAQIAETFSLRINADFAYDGAATDVRTAPRVAFELRRGVCQDFSHIMIAGLRGVGIPAGYVSGYLRTIPPKGATRLEGADAMHAWVRVWCGEDAGWLEFDPTNAMRAGEDHIVCGFGRDYSDVAPVVGVMRTLGDQKVSQAVDVVPLVSA